MKIALVSSISPFVYGGGRNIVEWLVPHLEEAGHQVEVIYLPFIDKREALFPQLTAYRTIDLTDQVDAVICFRPPSHLVRHPRKILWFIHHLRAFYDLWDTEYRGFPDDAAHRALRDAVRNVDNVALSEAARVFTNSAVVSRRLLQYNQVASEVLYPPVAEPERFHSAGSNGTVVCVARLEHHKRQHLLIEAMAHTSTEVRLRIVGTGSRDYVQSLAERVSELGVGDRVAVEDRWISEDEKVEVLSTCLASAYLPFDEDSYGYPSIEAALSRKATLTTSDAGGVLELVQDGRNGLIAEPTPVALAAALDRLASDQARTASMGEAAYDRLAELGIDWATVVNRILA